MTSTSGSTTRLIERALSLVSGLPRNQQDVFVLCGWFGLSYEDTAFALGLPVGTVRSRLSRARRRLQELGNESGHEQCRQATVQEA